MDNITIVFGIFIILFSIVLFASFYVHYPVEYTKCRPDTSNTEIKKTVRCSATPEYDISDRVPENSYNSSLYPGHQIGTSVNAGS